MKKGDIVVRKRESHLGMKTGDIDEVVDNVRGNISLLKYNDGTHDDSNLRLATEEEVIQYYKRMNIPYKSETNYQIY